MENLTLQLGGMRCATCAATIEEALQGLPGVTQGNVNFAADVATVTYDPRLIAPAQIAQAVVQVGYQASLLPDGGQETHHSRPREGLGGKILLGGVVSLLLWGGVTNPWLQLLLTTPVQFWVGGQFYQGALNSLRHRSATMDTLVAAGTSAAYGYSLGVTLWPGGLVGQGLTPGTYFDTSTVVITLVLVGKYLEARARQQTTQAIRKLLGLQPQTARVVRQNRELTIPLPEVQVGDLVVVLPGEKVPVDGEILEGSTRLDESMVTGESRLVAKGPGEEVIGATLNHTGSFRFRATRVGRDTFLAQMVRLVQAAQGSKVPLQRVADRVIRWFVPGVMTVAILTFVLWFDLTGNLTLALVSSVGVLVVACPCALGLATPMAVTVGIGQAARRGILVREARSLQVASRVTTVVLDKTGTLTEGRPTVTDFFCLAGVAAELPCLGLAGSVERHSEHPLGKAVLRYAQTQGALLGQVRDFEAVPGRGVTATLGGVRVHLGNEAWLLELGMSTQALAAVREQLNQAGKTLVWLAVDSQVAAVFGIADALKPSARLVVQALQRRGVEVVMLTGDQAAAALSLAREAGVRQVVSQVRPAQKLAYIQALQARGQIVAMVGDGINDAPALAQADLSLAMGTGTEVAMGASDITLVSGDLVGILTVIELSRATLRTMHQNLFFAFVYNLLTIPVAAGILYPIDGWLLNPALAGAAMAFSSLSVVGNSLRLGRFSPRVYV